MSTRIVRSSTTTNCSGFSSEPAFIWKVGKPPTETARSSDHLTSFADHRRAVLEDRVPAEPEGDRHVAGVHVLGELGLELVAVVGRHPVRTRLHLVADEPVVAVPRRLIARDVSADAVMSRLFGPLSETMSSVSCRPCAFAGDHTAGMAMPVPPRPPWRTRTSETADGSLAAPRV